MDAMVTAMLMQAAMPVAPPAPPAPPIVYAPPPIVSSTRVGIGSAASNTRERFVVDVEVRAHGDVLWAGPMVVSTVQGTSFLRRLTEPAPDDCAPNAYGQQVENSLSVQITPQRQFDGGGAFGVSVHWGRSLPGACPFRNSSRTVELNETVGLTPGRSVTLNGDADLTLRLRRR